MCMHACILVLACMHACMHACWGPCGGKMGAFLNDIWLSIWWLIYAQLLGAKCLIYKCPLLGLHFSVRFSTSFLVAFCIDLDSQMAPKFTQNRFQKRSGRDSKQTSENNRKWDPWNPEKSSFSLEGRAKSSFSLSLKMHPKQTPKVSQNQLKINQNSIKRRSRNETQIVTQNLWKIPQLAPKMIPKINPKSLNKVQIKHPCSEHSIGSIFGRFLIDFWSIFDWFWSPFEHLNRTKLIENWFH